MRVDAYDYFSMFRFNAGEAPGSRGAPLCLGSTGCCQCRCVLQVSLVSGRHQG